MSKSIKYGVIGSTGRLGSEVIPVFAEKGHRLVYEYSIEGENQTDTPQVLIDCSLPEVLSDSIHTAIKFNASLIVATTGLTDLQLNELKKLSAKVAVVQSYNFSIGIQVLLKLTQITKETLTDWDVEIIETHHRFKKDKPSGTAKMIQQLFSGKDINTSSLRLGNIPGEHTVHFGGLGEVISISHNATSRRTFAEGILLSVNFIIDKKSGLYSFTDIVFSNNS